MILYYYILCLFSFPLELAKGTFVAGAIKPGCETQCGNVTVPFPFGIAKGDDRSCSLNDRFFLTCYTSSSEPPKLFLRDGNIQIYKISDSELRINSWGAFTCYDQDGSVSQNESTWINFSSEQYTFSEKNKFTVIGCDDYSLIKGRTLKAQTNDFSSGCVSSCIREADVANDGQCLGNGCCQISIANGLQYYEFEVNSFQNHTEVWDFNHCSFAFLGEEGTFEFRGASDLANVTDLWRRMADVPVVVDWVVARNRSCAEATECKQNSECDDVEGGGYRCRCNQGYEGNPYLDSGCRDIDECTDKDKYPCYGECINTLGDYTCNCEKGYSGDPKVSNGCQKNPQKLFRQTLLFKLGIGLALPAIVIGLLVLYFTGKKGKQARLREKYFEQNGGPLLKDKLKTKGGVGVNSVNIFRIEELEEATDNFSESKVLGKGGNGTVYKGTLTDKRLVAIKKSQRVDQGQREEFINEMVILTQINHTNVVQLIGFCLEDDVPLLAYEFVSNDTLHRHIHNRTTGRLSWDTRLRIAHESAGALAYLHTDARMSIIHRDVKSTNILLDENYTAKIADFGASRLVPLGHNEVVTLVQGTLGYLDPEYFHSGQLTDKSDVYSFGVVLAELLTGQQPLNMERCLKERNLATYFLKAVTENTFLDILEHGVVKEATYEQLKAMSGLVCRCLNQVGGNRPSMKEVTMELETLRKLGKPTNSVSEDNYNEMSSLMIEMEPTDLYTVPLMPRSDTFGDSSITSEMQDMMLQLKSAR